MPSPDEKASKILKKLSQLDFEKLRVLGRLADIDFDDLKRFSRFNREEIKRLSYLEYIQPEDLPLVYRYVARHDHEVIAPEVKKILSDVSEYTLTSRENLQCLCDAIEHIVTHNISGCIVECGVWKGGSMMAAAKMLRHLGDIERPLFLFDTFEGMAEPEEVDIERHTGKSADELMGDRNKSLPYMAYAGLEEVKSNMATCDYPSQHIHFIQGKVEETLPVTETGPIALLRLDTDWYASTKCELEYLYDKLVPGGILIIDDYGHFKGAQKAVDEFFKGQKFQPFLHRIDYTARLVIKPH